MATGAPDLTISIGAAAPQQVRVTPAASLWHRPACWTWIQRAARQGFTCCSSTRRGRHGSWCSHKAEMQSSRLYELQHPGLTHMFSVCLHLQQLSTPYWASAHPITDYVRVDGSVSIYYEVHGLPPGG
jgi:hypothetical protein